MERTQKEIDRQITRLKQLKNRLPEFNFFNENNHIIIDAQIEVLKGEIQDEDAIYAREDELGDRGVSELLQTLEWLNGESDDELVHDDDLDRPMGDGHKKPCNECPFRKNHLQGWLGGRWTARALHAFVMSEQKFACHKTIEEEGKEAGTKVCIGSILYMNKNAKLCANPKMKKLQDKFRKEDTSNILNVSEFLEHHKNSIETK